MSKYHDPIQSIGVMDLSGLFKRDPIMGGIFSKTPNTDASGNILPDTATGRRMLAALAMSRIRGNDAADASIKVNKPELDLRRENALMQNATTRHLHETAPGSSKLGAETQLTLAEKNNANAVTLQNLANEGYLNRLREASTLGELAADNAQRRTFAGEDRTKEREERLLSRALLGDRVAELIAGPRLTAVEQGKQQLRLGEQALENSKFMPIGTGLLNVQTGATLSPSQIIETTEMQESIGGLQVPVKKQQLVPGRWSGGSISPERMSMHLEEYNKAAAPANASVSAPAPLTATPSSNNTPVPLLSNSLAPIIGGDINALLKPSNTPLTLQQIQEQAVLNALRRATGWNAIPQMPQPSGY